MLRHWPISPRGKITWGWEPLLSGSSDEKPELEMDQNISSVDGEANVGNMAKSKAKMGLFFILFSHASAQMLFYQVFHNHSIQKQHNPVTVTLTMLYLSSQPPSQPKVVYLTVYYLPPPWKHKLNESRKFVFYLIL